MRIRIEQARDADRGCAEAEHAAPVPVGPVSGDPVRDALSALRAARRRGQATAVDAAVEALSARASDPLGAVLSPPRLAAEPRELDDKDAPDRESEPPGTSARLQVGGAPPPRAPDIRLLAQGLDAQVMEGAARRAGGDAGSAESEDKPKLPEATRGERSTDPARADKDPAHPGRHARHPDHARAMRDARIQAEQRQKKIDKSAKGLAAGPKPADDKQAKKPGAKGAVTAAPVPKLKTPAKQPRDAKDKGGGAAGGKGDPVEAWHGRVVAKANAITAPEMSDEDRYTYSYQAATTKAAKQTPAEKIKLIKTAQEAVPPVDKFQGQDDDLKLPSPDPMPEKRQAVLDKTRRTLKPQSLPDLDRSPLNSLPELGTMVYSEEGSGTKHVLRELAPGEGYAEIVIVPTGGKPPPVLKGMKTEVREDKKLEDGKGTLSERVKAHNAKEPRNITGKGGTGNAKGATISNDMPKGTPKLPRLESIPKVDTGKVIAAVMAQTDPASKGIVDGALEAFPGNKPLKAAAGFTDVFVPPVKADILKEMQRIAGKAGSGADAIKSKVDAEKEKADAAAAANQAALDDASKGAKKERWRYSEQIADHIGGLLDDMERTIDDQTAIAKGGFDPKAVKAEERRLRDTNETMVSTWLGNYSTLKKNRTDSLIKEQTRQTNAYQATAELDKQTLDKKAGDKPDQDTTDNVTKTKTDVDKWLSDHLTDVPKKVADLIAESAADIATYKRELKSAADDYDTEIQNWAKDRIHREKSWWKKLIDVIKDWLGVVTTEKKNWQERSNTDNETTLANDEAELDLMIVNDTGDQTEESIKARKDLTEAQKAIALSYFTGAHQGDSAVALAAGLIVQLGSQWRPQIVKQIETKVLSSADQLIIDVANATPGFDVDNHVTDIISGFKGAGTDKDKVYGALKTKTGTMTRIQARAVELRYRERTKSSLRSDINSELYDVGDMIASIVPGSSGHADENRAFALLDADEDASAKEIAAQLDAAMHKNAWGTGLGTDKETIYKLLRGKNAEERAAIKAAYREMTGKELDKDVEAELDDGVSPVYDVNQYYALMRGDKEGADAIAMRRAHGWVSDNWVDQQINKVMFQDVKVADQVYQDIRTDVDADAAAASAAGRPWDNAEYDRQLRRRLDSLDKKFGDQFGYDFNVKPGQSALEAAHQTMGGDKAKMLIGERRNDLAMESAARISIEHKATILPDKAEVNKALEAQYTRAFAEERRTLENAEQLEQKKAWDDCTVKPKSESTADKLQAEKDTEQKRKQWRKDWLDPDGKAKRKRELDRKAEAKAAESTKTKMSALKATYEKDFGSGSMFSTGSFEGDVYSATNVTWPGQRNADNDKTMALLGGSGYLTPDQQLLFGVKGAGTSEEAVHKAYAGRTRAEIEQIHRNLQGRLSKIGVADNAVDWVLDDFSGSELDDIKIEQMGEPTTNAEKLEVERERARLQKESVKRTTTGDYILGALTGVPPGAFSSMRNYMSEDDNKYIDGRIAKLEQSIADLETEKERLKKAGINEGDQEWYDKLAPFRDRIDVNTEGVKIGVEGNRATLNAAVSWATVGIQVVVGIATLIAGIVLTPVTGGLSTAIAIAVIGALVTAAATMAAKAAFKGGAYGWEEAAQDGAMALVDAVAAGLTAGYGSKILGALSWAAKEGEALVMAAVKKAVNTAIQKTIGHFVMGALQAIPSALIGALADGGDLMSALEGILQAGVMSVVISNATEGITAHFQNAKVLAARTNPEQFKAALAHYATEHPSVPAHELPGRLRAELDQALFAHNKDVFKEPAMQDKLRAEMLEGVPPNRRAEYANAKIEMKSPAEMNALTGNAKAESAVTMKNGTPTVAIKAGAVLEGVGASLPALPKTPAVTPKPGAPVAPHTAAPPHPVAPHAAAPPKAAPPVEHAAAPKAAPPPVEHAAAAPKAAPPPVEHAAAPKAAPPPVEHAAAPKVAPPVEHAAAAPKVAPPPVEHAPAPPKAAPPVEHAAAPPKAAPPAEHAAAPPSTPHPVEHAEAAPVPHGASATPDPRAPVEPGAAPPKKLIVEPLAGPKLESAIDLALKNPDANVVATERSIKPPAGEIARAEKAGVSFIPENKTPALAPGSVDEMKMRFPIPHERTAEQDWHLRLAEVEQTHPNLDRWEKYKLASKMTEDLAESLTAYGPYALERLKPGGKLEVVFHEPSIMGELGDVSRMRFIDPQTGKGFRLEVVDIEIRTRGEVAPHSGFGIPEMTHATEVRVATFEKVELATKLPTGARGSDIAAGEVVGKFSGRRFTPREAGGPIRELDYSRIKFTERAVDVVEAHVRRFDGGGEMELAMVDRLRAIAAGKLEATEFDRAFLSHELRESVRYRQLGLSEGQPIDPGKAYEIWNNAHTATLEDYRLNERLAGGRRALFHPEIVEAPDLGPTGARGGRRPDVDWNTEVPLGVRHGDAGAQAEGGRCATWVWVEVMRNAGWVGTVASDPGQIAGLVRTLRDPVTGEHLPRIKGTPEELIASAKSLPPGSQIVISAKTENDVWHALLGRVNSDGSVEIMHGPRGTAVGDDRVYFAERGDLSRYHDHRWWVLPPIPEAPPHLRIGRPESELVLRPPARGGLPAGESLPPSGRRMLETDLVKGGRPLEALRALSDSELVVAHRELQVEQAPLRLAELRETVGWQAKGELDTLMAATHRMAEPIDPVMARSVSKAFEVPMVPDPSLDPHEIRVVPRKGLLGGLGGVEIHYGPQARLGDVLLHGGPVLTGKKLAGIAGLARRVALAVDNLLASGVYPPRGSRAADALEELHKLPGIIEQKRAQWGDASTDPVRRYQLEREIKTLEGQLTRHIGELADLSPGRGYIASEGTPAMEPPVKSPVRRPLAEATDLRHAPLHPSSFPPEVQKVIKGSWVHEALKWTATELRGLPKGEYMYVVRDAETGEVLKVGKSSHDGTGKSALDKRMGLYRNAAELTGHDVQVELHALTAKDAEPFETAVRKQLYEAAKTELAKQGLAPAALEEEIGKTFRWDNMVDHRRGKMIGPGTPGEPWTRKERVFVVSSEPAKDGVKKIRVRHDDGHEQDIVTRKTKAQAGKNFLIPRDELYGWVKVPGDPKNPVFQRGGATGDAPLVKTPGKADVIAALPDAERRAALAALLNDHRADRAEDVVRKAADALGIKKSKMFEMLSKVDPPLQPSTFKPLPPP